MARVGPTIASYGRLPWSAQDPALTRQSLGHDSATQPMGEGTAAHRSVVEAKWDENPNHMSYSAQDLIASRIF